MKQLSSNNYYFKISLKELLFFLFLWMLIYFEPIAFGPLKISQIWKGIIVGGLLIYVINKKLPGFIWIGILFSLKYFFYTEMPYGYLRAVQDALETLIFPLFLAYFYIKYRHRADSTEQLVHISLLLSIFIIFSSFPFLYGLESLNPITDLESYGLEQTATKGLFYSIASSSKLFTISTIILINLHRRFSNSFINRLIWITAVLLGSYLVYTSWTRTGWLIFSVALMFSLFYGTNLNKKSAAIIASIILLLGAVWLYDTSQAFRWRLTGGATYRTDTELSVSQLSKARLPFILVAIDNLNDEGIFGQLLGYGTLRGTDLFKQKTGMAIGSHNRTFEILESSGIIALLLYFSFIYRLFTEVIRNSIYITPQMRKLSYLSIILFSGFYFTSHGTPFWGEIIYSCFFVAMLIEGARAKGGYT